MLSKKIDQMVAGQRNVVVLDISHANVTETNVVDALYGSFAVEVGINSATDKPGILGYKRKTDGFFRKTTRIQAVVSVRRVVKNGSLDTVWTVFPTNNPRAETRLTAAELRYFGDLAAGTEALAPEGSE